MFLYLIKKPHWSIASYGALTTGGIPSQTTALENASGIRSVLKIKCSIL
jgi:hypothetical protein